MFNKKRAITVMMRVGMQLEMKLKKTQSMKRRILLIVSVMRNMLIKEKRKKEVRGKMRGRKENKPSLLKIV